MIRDDAKIIVTPTGVLLNIALIFVSILVSHDGRSGVSRDVKK